jgi:hypothetical protein
MRNVFSPSGRGLNPPEMLYDYRVVSEKMDDAFFGAPDEGGKRGREMEKTSIRQRSFLPEFLKF